MKARPRSVEREVAAFLTRLVSDTGKPIERIPVLGRTGPDLTYHPPLNLIIDVKSRIKRQKMTYHDPQGIEHKTPQARVEWGAIPNNQAEFKTAIVGVCWIREFYDRLGKMMPVTVCSDSELVVNTVKGINRKFKVLAIKQLADELPMVTFEYVDNLTVKSLLGH